MVAQNVDIDFSAGNGVSMAALSDNTRAQLWAELMQEISTLRQPTALTKAQWRTLVNDLDASLDARATQINGDISQPVRGIATATEKALAIEFIAKARRMAGG